MCNAVCTAAAWRGTWEPLAGCRLNGAVKQLGDGGMGGSVPQEPMLGYTSSTFQPGCIVTPEGVPGTTMGARNTFAGNRALGLEIPVMMLACKINNIFGQASDRSTLGNVKSKIKDLE